MDDWKLWLFLLLPLCLCFNTEEAIVKAIGREADITPLCTTATLQFITLIVCKIRTERNWGEECRLLYHHGQDFVHECDSRFTLVTKNQSVFLNLTSLTPEDSGNYTCECSHVNGTDSVHLIITVKGDEEDSTSPMKMLICTAVIGSGIALIIVTGVVLLLFLRENDCRDDTKPGPSGLPVCETSCSLGKDDPDNPYTSLQQPAGDLYQTFSSMHHQHNSKTKSATNNTVIPLLEQEIDGRETDQNCEIYEIV